MNYLFFIVHPAKFHFLRVTINTLKKEGHSIDIAIVNRDILEELIIEEGWEYTNLFPNGRKIKNLHIYLSAAINLIRTIFKLFHYVKNKKHDLYITDDLLTFVGKIKKIPTVFITDDDLRAVPESFLLAATATHILAPTVCNMGRYSSKKINYQGYKALAHFHPNHFQADNNKIPDHLLNKKYFLIRVVSPTSTHDVGKRGIDDSLLEQLVDFLSKFGLVIISNERKIPQKLEKYVLKSSKRNIGHIISFSSLFISDSTTMCAEAAVLGVPAIEIDDWHKDFKQYFDFNNKYELIFGFYPFEKKELFEKINELILAGDITNESFRNKKDRLLKENIDLSSFMIWLFSNYPKSLQIIKQNRSFQKEFIKFE